ncbi:hypothetical protein MIR68_007930 [Amoeboaphelidium protococcarum]|nr:hypothetical protein MIR68_007930 [Amoeboaphelidium protococcarum]
MFCVGDKDRLYYPQSDGQVACKQLDLTVDYSEFNAKLVSDEYRIVNFPSCTVVWNDQGLLMYWNVNMINAHKCKRLNVNGVVIVVERDGQLFALSQDGIITLINCDSGQVIGEMRMEQKNVISCLDYDFIQNCGSSNSVLVASCDGLVFYANFDDRSVERVCIIPDDIVGDIQTFNTLLICDESFGDMVIVLMGQSDGRLHVGLWDAGSISIIIIASVHLPVQSQYRIVSVTEDSIFIISTEGLYQLSVDVQSLKQWLQRIQSDSNLDVDFDIIKDITYVMDCSISNVEACQVVKDDLGLFHMIYQQSGNQDGGQSQLIQVRLPLQTNSSSQDQSVQQKVKSISQQSSATSTIDHKLLDQLKLTSAVQTKLKQDTQFPDHVTVQIHDEFVSSSNKVLDDIELLQRGCQYMSEQSDDMRHLMEQSEAKLLQLKTLSMSEIDQSAVQRFQFLVENQKRLNKRSGVMLSLLKELFPQNYLSRQEMEWIRNVYALQPVVKNLQRQMDRIQSAINAFSVNVNKDSNRQAESHHSTNNHAGLSQSVSLLFREDNSIDQMKTTVMELSRKVQALSVMSK